MAEAPLSLNMEIFTDRATGKPLFNAKIYIGLPDLDPAIEANRVSMVVVEEDGDRITIATTAQPLRTGLDGRIEYLTKPVVPLVDGTYSIKVLDSTDVQKQYAPRANETADAAINEGVAPVNGSFENESQFSGLPDNWSIAEGANGTIAVDATTQAHGLKSLKFVGTDATGAGTATSDRFNVTAGGSFDIRFNYMSTAATTLNKVDVEWFNAAGATVSTTSAYSEGVTNPAAFTEYTRHVSVPATAIQGEVILTGIDGAGTINIGTTRFDRVTIGDYPGRLAADLNDDNDNEVLVRGSVASAVNEVTITNAATGNDVAFAATGDDTNVGMDLQTKGTGQFQVNGVAIEETPAFFANVLVDYAHTGNNNVIFETEAFDITGDYDHTTGIFTPSVAGIYFIACNIKIVGSAAGFYVASYQKNGAGIASSSGLAPTAGYPNIAMPGMLVELNGTTDNVSVELHHTVTVDGQAASSTSASYTYFSGHRVQKLP